MRKDKTDLINNEMDSVNGEIGLANSRMGSFEINPFNSGAVRNAPIHNKTIRNGVVHNGTIAKSHLQKNLSRRGFLALGALGVSSLILPLTSCVSGSSTGSNSASSAQSILNLEQKIAEAVEEQISNMTLEQKVAQLFVVRPEDILGRGVTYGGIQDAEADLADAVTRMDDALGAALGDMPVGGVIYFARNLVDPEQTKSLLSGMKDAIEHSSGVVPLLCVDEEGGLIARVASNDAFGVEKTDSAADVGANGDAEQAKSAALEMASYLKPLGFNTDFAPVADVVGSQDSSSQNGISQGGTPQDEVTISRSFGSDPKKVADMVKAEVEGFNEADIICSLKHFPGCGATSDDTHVDKATTTKTIDELMSVDGLPFKAGIEAGAPMVMVGHLSAPNVDETDVPSSMSSIVIMNLLRRDLGFDGVVVTDALNMAAVSNYYDSGMAAINCFMAGCDMLLMPEDLEGAYSAIIETLKSGVISGQRLNESVTRILTMKQRYLANNAS